MGVSGDVLQLGIDVSANPEAAAQIDLVTASLAKFRAESAALSGGSTNIGAEINVAIGAFQRLGQTIDITNARAVAGFAAIGENLTAQLAKLGATEAELNRIGATITRVQQAAGATGLQNLVPSGLAGGLSGTSFATRRGADAITSLAFAAQAGTTSMQGLAIGAGSVSTSFLALAGTSLGVATGVGAIVTIGLTLVGVLDDMGKKSKSAEKNLEDLRTEMKKSASPEATRDLLKATSDALRQAQEQREILATQKRESAPASAFGPGGAPPVTGAQAAIAALDKQINNLQKQQASLLVDLERRGKSVTTELSDAQRQSDQETARLAVQQAQGQFAERRLVAEQEFENEKKRLTDLAVFDGQQTAAVNAAKRRRDQELAAINVEEAQKLTELKAQTDQKEIKAREATELSANKATLDIAEKGLEDSLAARTISEARFITERLAAQKAAIKADEQAQLDATGKILFSQQRAAKAAIGPEEKGKRQGDVAATEADLAKIRADARAKNAAAERDAAKASAALAEQLAHTVQQANVAVLESQGEFVRAAQVQVQAEFRTAIDTALAQIAAGNEAGFAALDAVLHRGEQIIQAARVREAQGKGNDIFANLQSNIRETQALAESGAISQAESQQRIVRAYQSAREQVAALIPVYQALSTAQPNNEDLARQTQDLKTQYIELGNTIEQLSDPFRQLKDAARSATTSGLGAFLEGVTKLGTQSHAEINSLAAEIANAQDELTTLLAQPNRSPNDNLRITELRSEIQQTTVALDNAKHAITTWKSLFLDAAQSIIDALIKVSSEMLAVRIIQGLSGLGGLFDLFGGGGGGSGLPAAPSTAAEGGFGFGFAEGGLIAGPGGPTSDSIPAMLSPGEFVMRAAAVRALGPNLLATLNDAGIGAPLNLRRGSRFFADGGIVRPSDGRAPAPSVHHFRFSVPEGFTLEHIRSSDGQRAIVEVISDRANAVNAALGR